jgi:hypothetical protein
MQAISKTPSDVTDFEKEQLRFFLDTDDAASKIAAMNPSLAWLPLFAEMRVIKFDTPELATWIEQNFAEVQAVRDVVTNLRFFGPETADLLDFRLRNRKEALAPLLAKSWRLIIRHMRSATRRPWQHDWFELVPRLNRGEQSVELFERVATAFRPKLVIEKRLSLHDDGKDGPTEPSDLMAINYEVDADVREEKLIDVWPDSVPAEADERLLSYLSAALDIAIEDAMEAGVEINLGYSTSDVDVPSVAAHEQNAYRSGFQPIVRSIADLWTRLAKKRPRPALAFAERWKSSTFKLVRRIALFAGADGAVPPDIAADMLLTIRHAELFATNTTVEVFRLILARWNEFSDSKREAIEQRICEGPPRELYKEGADFDRLKDRGRFDLLGEIERANLILGKKAKAVLDEIRQRWPTWKLRPPEQAGFHIWSGGGRYVESDSSKLRGVPDDRLVSEAKKLADAADFLEGDSWQGVCQGDPDRALRGLEHVAASGEWPVWAWEQLLWSRQKFVESDAPNRIARLLLKWPGETFSEIVRPASSWLANNATALTDDTLWPLWDRVAVTASSATAEEIDGDVLTAALNVPSGHLAEVVVRKVPKPEGSGPAFDQWRERADRLCTAGGHFGQLARVRLAVEVSLLYEHVPTWTTQQIVPLFYWDSPEAGAAWSARKYSRFIGSPELFGLTKEPFLELFARPDVSAEDVRSFSDWLVAVMLANTEGVNYPITPAEARVALRRGGTRALPSAAHRLAVELGGGTAEEKGVRWRDKVGPVFQAIWPLDVDLQTSATTFKLVQILLATGTAFAEAADVILPFVQPDRADRGTTVFAISNADELLYSAGPGKMLDLVAAVVGEDGRAYQLEKALNRIRDADNRLASTRKFQKLLDYVTA